MLALEHSREKFEMLLPAEKALDDIPALPLSENSANRLRCGQSIPAPRGANWLGENITKANNLAYATIVGKLLAVVIFQDNYLKPVRVFNL